MSNEKNGESTYHVEQPGEADTELQEGRYFDTTGLRFPTCQLTNVLMVDTADAYNVKYKHVMANNVVAFKEPSDSLKSPKEPKQGGYLTPTGKSKYSRDNMKWMRREAQAQANGTTTKGKAPAASEDPSNWSPERLKKFLASGTY